MEVGKPGLIRRIPAWTAVVLALLAGAFLGIYLSGVYSGNRITSVTYTLPESERGGKSGLAVSPATVAPGARVPLVVKNLSDFAAPVLVSEVDAAGVEKPVWQSDRPLQPGEAVRLDGVSVRRGVRELRVKIVAEGSQGLGVNAVFVVAVRD